MPDLDLSWLGVRNHPSNHVSSSQRAFLVDGGWNHGETGKDAFWTRETKSTGSLLIAVEFRLVFFRIESTKMFFKIG